MAENIIADGHKRQQGRGEASARTAKSFSEEGKKLRRGRRESSGRSVKDNLGNRILTNLKPNENLEN